MRKYKLFMVLLKAIHQADYIMETIIQLIHVLMKVFIQTGVVISRADLCHRKTQLALEMTVAQIHIMEVYA